MTDENVCEAVVFPRTRTQPEEKCTEPAVEGSEYCEFHAYLDDAFMEDYEPDDWTDDYELTEADREAFRALGLDEGTPF